MKPQHFFCYLAVVAVLFTACKKDKEVTGVTITDVTGVTLNDKELFLAPNDTVTLIATVQPDDATNKTITWTSSNPTVATVNSNGLVTALTDGKTTITATAQDSNKKTTCEVMVDYRNNWVGSYECEYIRSFHVNMTDDSYSDTLQGIIAIVTIRRDSSLFIVGKEEYDIKVNSDGSFKGDIRGFEGAFGNFGNDSIKLNYVIISPGATSWRSHNGKKIKN